MRHHRRWLLLTLAYCVATLLLTYPVALQLNTHLAGESSTSSDTLESLWGVWWWKHALIDLRRSPLDISTLDHPDGQRYALYPLTAQAFALALPVALISPVLAYNLVFLLAFVLSGLAGYALCAALTGDHLAAFVAGLIWAFFPAKMAHAVAGHLPLIVLPALPLMALGVWRLLKAPSVRAGLVAGALIALAATIHPTYLVYIVAPLVVGLIGYAAWTGRRAFWRRETIMALAVMAGVSVALIALLIAPMLIDLAQGRPVRFTPGTDVVGFSPDALGFFVPSSDHPLIAGTPLREPIVRLVPYQYEHLTYVGWITLLLAIVGAWTGRAGDGRVWTRLAIGAAIFALGPVLKLGGDFAQVIIAGEPYRIVLPYALIGDLPFIEWSRTPGRLSVTLMLALSVLAALGVKRLRQLPHFAWTMGPLTVIILIESIVRWPFPTTPASAPSPLLALRTQADARAAVQVPLTHYVDNQRLLFWQTVHQHPMTGGRVYRDLPEAALRAQFYRALVMESGTLTREQRWAALDAVNIGWIIYDAQADAGGELRPQLEAAFGPPLSADSESAVFRVPPSASVPIHARFENLIELLGAWPPESAAPGRPVTVLVLWRALAPIHEDFTAFIHVLDASGQLVAQSDTQPLNGRYPTSQWSAGVHVGDQMTIQLPAALPPGLYEMRLGLYHQPDAARLQVSQAHQVRDDTVVLGLLRVE